MGALTLAKADELVWLGRYTERVFTTLKEFFRCYDANVDVEAKDFSEFCEALDIAIDPEANVDAALSDILYNPDNPASVCSSMRAAFGNAILLRPELGTQVTSYVELALMNLRGSKDPIARLPMHRTVRDDLLAFWGSVEDSVDSGEAKALLFFGKYVERLELWSRFGATERQLDRPLRKLAFYLCYVTHPECLPVADTLATLESNLGARGYGKPVCERVRTLVEAARA